MMMLVMDVMVIMVEIVLVKMGKGGDGCDYGSGCRDDDSVGIVVGWLPGPEN